MNSIAEIISGCRRFEPMFQRLAYERYKMFALRIVFRYIFSYENAVEVTNDGFVKIFTHFNTFQENGDGNNEKRLAGWIKRIMINTAIDELRRKSLLPEIGEISDGSYNIADDQQADHQALYKDLILLIKRMPPQYRIVFNMYVIDGYSHKEIADALEIAEGTSKSTLSRARYLLQRFLKEQKSVRV